MKKQLAVSLALFFTIGFAGTAFAASTPDAVKEIEALKVRIAELEKNVKPVKSNKNDANKLSFDGSDFRVRWINDSKNGGDSVFQQRVRLNMKYKINDDLNFNARWRLTNENEFGTSGEDDQNKLTDVNVSIKNVMGSTMTMGRFSQAFGATGYWNSASLGMIDGVKFSTGKDVKLTFGFANFGAYTAAKETITVTENATTGKHTVKVETTHSPVLDDAFFVNASFAPSKATTLYAMYLKEKSGVDSDFNVAGLGVRTKINDAFQFWGDYTKNFGKPNDPTGCYLSLRWKEADESIPGTFGMRLDYRNIKNGNMFSTSGQGVSIPTQKFKGPAVSAHYAIAKNIILEGFQTFKTKDADTGESKPNYTRFQTTVSF